MEAIFKAAVEGPDAIMEIYACLEKAISSLIVTDWIQARKQIQLSTK